MNPAPLAAGRPFGYWRDPVCLGGVVLYLVNRLVVKPATGDPTDFFHCYVNDVLCLPVWLPVVLWLQRRARLRTTDLPPTASEIAVHWLLWSWVFEAFAPSFPEVWPRTVADPWDVVAYGVGGLIAGVLWRSPTRPVRPRLFAHGAIATLIVVATVATLLLTEAFDGHWRVWHLWHNGGLVRYRGEAVEEFRRTHGRLPERLSDVGPDIPRGVDEYRRMGEDFVLIAYGTDRAAGGLGDGEDICYPSEHGLHPWYSYFFTKISRWDATLYGVLGVILAGSWLVMRSRTIPPFRLPSRVQVAKVLLYVSLSLTVATLIISSERFYPSSH